MKFFKKYWAELILGILVVSYIAYFSFFSILRYHTLYSHYFDLGIMNQTVYNTFMAIKTGDYSRFLELTNPHGFDQVKRMSVHNDMFLALLAPFYFIYSGPETLLVLQSIASALGAIALFMIGKKVFANMHNMRLVSLFFSFAYLFYPPLERANQFDFHAVVFATPLLLFMFYFFLQKKYWISGILAFLAILTKEQVGLTVAFFGLFVIARNIRTKNIERKKEEYFFALVLALIGIGWFIFSMTQIIPYFRQGAHFALGYFGDFGDSPGAIFKGLVQNPQLVLHYIFRKDTAEYVLSMLGPLSFLSLFSPLHLLIAAPEWGINLISNNGTMRNIYFHYTAVITPFVCISALYGFQFLIVRSHKIKVYTWFFIALLFVGVLYFSYTVSPLPYSRTKEMRPFLLPARERFEVYNWQERLKDDSIRVMSSGRLSPFFSSRRFYYNMSKRYDLAEYIVLSVDDVYNGFQNEVARVAYKELLEDQRFEMIYKKDVFEVYKKL